MDRCPTPDTDSGRAFARACEEILASAGDVPDVWPKLQARLQKARRRRHHARSLAAAAVLLLTGTNAAAYLVPRAGLVLADALHGASADTGTLAGALVSAPGVFGLLGADALLPVHAAATVHGVTLTVLGAYFDGRETVIPYQVRGSGRTPATEVAQPWAPVLSNVDQISLGLAGRSAGMSVVSGIRSYPITLADQFGMATRVRSVVGGTDGIGAFIFPGFPAWMRAAGLRLTLRVGAMERVLAPDGPLGAKTVQVVPAAWRVPFTVFPPATPTLTLTPRSRAGAGDAVLQTVVNVPSGSYLRLTGSGTPPLSGPDVFWRLTGPDGRTILPISGEGTPTAWRLHFPPLTAAGAYLLTNGPLSLAWTQPAWNPSFTWQAPSPPSPLYQGTDWQAALKLAGFPAVPPPPGARLLQATVHAAFGQPRRSGTPLRQIQMRVQTAEGVYQVTESPTWLTPVPAAITAAEFASDLEAGNPKGAYSALSIGGAAAQLWTLPGSQGQTGVPLLTVYPSWGSVEIVPLPGGGASASGAVRLAEGLLRPGAKADGIQAS